MELLSKNNLAVFLVELRGSTVAARQAIKLKHPKKMRKPSKTTAIMESVTKILKVISGEV